MGCVAGEGLAGSEVGWISECMDLYESDCVGDSKGRQMDDCMVNYVDDRMGERMGDCVHDWMGQRMGDCVHDWMGDCA